MTAGIRARVTPGQHFLDRSLPQDTPGQEALILTNDSPSITYTVREFCRAEHIAVSTLYKLWKAGRGPRSYCIGASRRITEQARQDWHRVLEAEGAAKGPRVMTRWAQRDKGAKG